MKGRVGRGAKTDKPLPEGSSPNAENLKRVLVAGVLIGLALVFVKLARS